MADLRRKLLLSLTVTALSSVSCLAVTHKFEFPKYPRKVNYPCLPDDYYFTCREFFITTIASEADRVKQECNQKSENCTEGIEYLISIRNEFTDFTTLSSPDTNEERKASGLDDLIIEAYLTLENPKKAVEHYRTHIENSNNHHALISIAKFYQQNNQNDEAMKFWLEYLSIPFKDFRKEKVTNFINFCSSYKHCNLNSSEVKQALLAGFFKARLNSDYLLTSHGTFFEEGKDDSVLLISTLLEKGRRSYAIQLIEEFQSLYFYANLHPEVKQVYDFYHEILKKPTLTNRLMDFFYRTKSSGEDSIAIQAETYFWTGYYEKIFESKHLLSAIYLHSRQNFPNSEQAYEELFFRTGRQEEIKQRYIEGGERSQWRYKLLDAAANYEKVNNLDNLKLISKSPLVENDIYLAIRIALANNNFLAIPKLFSLANEHFPNSSIYCIETTIVAMSVQSLANLIRFIDSAMLLFYR